MAKNSKKLPRVWTGTSIVEGYKKCVLDISFVLRKKNSPNTHFNKGSKRSWHCSAVCLVWQFIKLVALTKTHGGAYGLAFVAVLLLERVAQRRRIRTAFGLNFLGKKS